MDDESNFGKVNDALDGVPDEIADGRGETV